MKIEILVTTLFYVVSGENNNNSQTIPTSSTTTPQVSASQETNCQNENKTIWETVYQEKNSKDCVTVYEEVCQEETCSPITTIKCGLVAKKECKPVCRRVCQVKTKLVWEPIKDHPCAPKNISCESIMIGNKPVMPLACNLFLPLKSCLPMKRQAKKLEKFNCKTYRTTKQNCKDVERLMCEEIPDQKCRTLCSQEPKLNCTDVIKKVPVRVSKMISNNCDDIETP